MAISFVQSLIASPTTQTTTAATLTMTTTAAASSGNTIIATAVCGRSTAPTACTFSDGGGVLTWSTAIFAVRAASIVAVAIGWASAPSGFASSSTITSTWDQSTTRRAIDAYEFSGLDPVSPVDVTQSSSNGSGTNVTGTTTATAQADSLAIGVWSMLETVAGVTGTPGTNSGSATGGTVTEIMDVEIQSTTGVLAYAEYQILTATGTVNLNFTPSTAGANIGAVAVFKGAAASVVTPRPALVVPQAVNRGASW